MNIKFRNGIYEVENVFNTGHLLLITIKGNERHVCKIECLSENQATDYVLQITNGKTVDLSEMDLTNAWS